MKENAFEAKDGLNVNKCDKLIMEPILPAETSIESDSKDIAEWVEYFSEIYDEVGFEIPWVGYTFRNEQGHVVGFGGFSGPPEDDEVKLDYVVTYDESISIETVIGIYRELLEIAYKADENIMVSATTNPLNSEVYEVFVKSGFLTYQFPDDPVRGQITWIHKKHLEKFSNRPDLQKVAQALRQFEDAPRLAEQALRLVEQALLKVEHPSQPYDSAG